MLASPVRICTLTYIHLPLNFLSAFSLVSDPRTGSPWLNPKETSIDYLGKRESFKTRSERSHQASRPDPEDLDHTLDNAELTNGSAMEVSAHSSAIVTASHLQYAQSSSNRAIAGPSPLPPLSIYFVSSLSALGNVSSLGSRQNHRFVPNIWRDKHGIQPRDIVWRKDMSGYVLEQMRGEAMKGFQYLASRPGSVYLVPVQEAWGGVDNITQAGAFLWTGAKKRKTDADESLEDDGELKVLTPPPYAMLDWRKHRTAVYNLPYLLGERNLERLLEGMPIFENELIAIKRKPNTAGLQMVLWKIMGYLASCDKLPGLDVEQTDSVRTNQSHET